MLTELRDGSGNYLFRGHTESFVIPATAVEEYNKLHEANKDNMLQKDSIVNLSPLSDLPSYKLKNYIDENKLNIQTARKYDKIDTIILNHKLIDDGYVTKNSTYSRYEDNKNIYVITKEFLFKNFHEYINHAAIGDKKSQWNDITQYGGQPITHYFVSEEDIDLMTLQFPKLQLIKEKIEPIYGNVIYKSHGSKKITDNVDFFISLSDIVEKHNLKVVFDVNINEEMNQGISLDIDMFENIFNMLESNDEGNHEIAKEILANCEYEASKPYLIYLYNFFPVLRKTSPNKNYMYLRGNIKQYCNHWYGKQDVHTFNIILPALINKHPQYAQEFMDCFKYHLNRLIKKDVILDIKVK